VLPEKRFGVAVLSSMQSAALPQILERHIFDREARHADERSSAEAYARSLTQRKRADSVEKAQSGDAPGECAASHSLRRSGTYTDSLYGDVTVTLRDGKLELRHGEWFAPLQYWNATNFRWLLPPGSPAGQLFIKFDVDPNNTVTGLYFGLPSDLSLLTRKNARGGRGGGRGASPPR
jgi:hypothetical protein